MQQTQYVMVLFVFFLQSGIRLKSEPFDLFHHSVFVYMCFTVIFHR